MSTLYDEVTKGGFEINDKMKYEYLKKSILRSPNHMLIMQMIMTIQVKYCATELNGHRDRGNENGLNKGMRAMRLILPLQKILVQMHPKTTQLLRSLAVLRDQDYFEVINS